MSEARNELGGAVGYAFVVAGDVVECVQGLHQVIARRSFGFVGPTAAPARLLHDGIAAGVYRALEVGARGAQEGASLASGLLPAEVQQLSRLPAGGRVVAVLNGMAGDRLAAAGSGAAIQMAVRSCDADVVLERQAVAAAISRAGDRLAVFVHGLCGTEHSWDARSGPDSVCYGDLLETELSYTPVYVRYNTGLHVSENGRALSALMERLMAVWPAPVHEIALVGHSMGGLVVRSACHYGSDSRARWTEAVRHVACLGAPHLGAPLEQATGALCRSLAVLPETRPFARLVNRRSVGIKDLRFGALVDEDWLGRDADTFLRDACREVPFLETAAYYFVAVTVTEDREHPLGRALGDLLVRFPSASGQGRTRRVPFEAGRGRHIGRMHHLDLLHRREVYEQLRRWLDL
jgi:pimeloyl-ACP methyl ester carboxylesterase